MKTIFAHRGMSTLAPENTLAAFKLCRQHGVRWIECDLDMLADGTVVLSHDHSLERCTDRTGCLSDLTIDDLQDIDAGSWFSDAFIGEPMPTLDALIQLANDEGLNLNLEIKSCVQGWKPTLTFIDNVIDALSQLNDECDVLVSSFNLLALSEFKRRAPQFKVACLFEQQTFNADWLSLMQACDADYIHLQEKGLSQETVKEIKRHGYFVHVYTVNHLARANELFNWGVDGIFTDVAQAFPARYLQTQSSSLS